MADSTDELDQALQAIETEIRNARPKPNTRLTYDGGIGRAWRIVAAHRRALRLGYERATGERMMTGTSTDDQTVSEDARRIIQAVTVRALQERRASR